MHKVKTTDVSINIDSQTGIKTITGEITMSNNLFAEINPQEEATLSGGYFHILPYYPRRRRPGRADATADAQASGRQVFTNTFTNATVDQYGNASATSSSTSSAIG